MRWSPAFPLPVLVIALTGCMPGGTESASRHARGGSPPVVPISAPEIKALARRTGARATLVNIWATWCAPCRDEFPGLLRVARAHQRDGLRLVLVSADFADQMPAIHRFLSAQGVGDTTYIKTGEDMAFIDTLSAKWSGALPATFLYDGKGQLTDFWEGRADEARFARAVNEILAHHSMTEERSP